MFANCKAVQSAYLVEPKIKRDLSKKGTSSKSSMTRLARILASTRLLTNQDQTSDLASPSALRHFPYLVPLFHLPITGETVHLKQ